MGPPLCGILSLYSTVQVHAARTLEAGNGAGEPFGALYELLTSSDANHATTLQFSESAIRLAIGLDQSYSVCDTNPIERLFAGQKTQMLERYVAATMVGL